MTSVRESSSEHANHADLRWHFYCRLSFRLNRTGLRHVLSNDQKQNLVLIAIHAMCRQTVKTILYNLWILRRQLSNSNAANNKWLLFRKKMLPATNRNQHMNLSKRHNYPRTVYDNAWEDLSVMYESWKTVHGIDRQFCIDMIRNFANYLEHEKY